MSIDKFLYDTQAKIVKRTSSPGYGDIYFEATSTRELSSAEIGDLQMNAGYHPAGYGCYGISEAKHNDGTYTYRWHSSRSCD